jgi:hypothetical protein
VIGHRLEHERSEGDRPIRAASLHRDELFFVEREVGVDTSAVVSEARAICAGCPVVVECADAGATEAYGVWGGMSVMERRLARRRIRRAA